MTGHAKWHVRRATVGSVAIFGLTAGLLTAGLTSAGAAEAVDTATLVEVDRPGTTMISAAPFDVGEYGYVEREFFASGEANQYLNADGTTFGLSPADRLATATQGDPAGDYTTRVVVRQPSAEIFNGTLVVEWTNVTTGQDGEFTFAESYDTLLSAGYAVAVISVQQTGVDNLVATLPERYGDLEVDPEDCAIDACPRDTMAWDILGEVSKALKDSPDSPFAQLGVSKVIAVGQSGSAGYLSTYYNTVHPIHNFFDGMVFWDSAGPLRTDIATPGIGLSSWAWNTGGPVPQTGEYTREWEINGAAHGSFYAHEYFDEVFVRDGTQPNGQSFTDWHLGIGQCTNTNVGTKVRVGHVIGGAVAAADTWSRGGQPAAPTAAFERDADGDLVLDDRDMVIGGVQIADAAAPTARYLTNSGGWTCPAAGAWGEYTPQELEQMYVSHDAYVDQVTAVTEAALEQRYIVASDAEATIAQAVGSQIAETDIALAGAADVTEGKPGQDVTLSVTPELVRGAWLESEGAPVPVTISGRAYVAASPEGADTSDAALIWESDLTITDLSSVEAGVLTLPDDEGTVSVVWCIDAALQSEEFPGHVNETCTSDSLPTLTVSVVEDDPVPDDETPTVPDDDRTPGVPDDDRTPVRPGGAAGGGSGAGSLPSTGAPVGYAVVAVALLVLAGAATRRLSHRG